MTMFAGPSGGESLVETAGELRVVAGPDAGQVFAVPLGRSVLGRDKQCEFTIRDAHVEPHHVLVDAQDTGSILATQLSGRLPMLVDHRLSNRALIAEEGTQLEIGATRLTWHPPSDFPPSPTPPLAPMIGWIDAGDRAGGLDAVPAPSRSSQVVTLSPETQALTIVGAEVGPCLRAIVGQLAQAGWWVRCSHPEAACHLDAGFDAGFDAGSRGVVVVNANDLSTHPGTTSPGDTNADEAGSGGTTPLEADLVIADLVITVTDDETELDVTGMTGAAIVVGERSRGRYSASIRDLETVRLHLVGWHPTTFAAACAARSVRPRPT